MSDSIPHCCGLIVIKAGMLGYKNWKGPYRTSSPASPFTGPGMLKENSPLICLSESSYPGFHQSKQGTKKSRSGRVG